MGATYTPNPLESHQWHTPAPQTWLVSSWFTRSLPANSSSKDFQQTPPPTGKSREPPHKHSRKISLMPLLVSLGQLWASCPSSQSSNLFLTMLRVNSTFYPFKKLWECIKGACHGHHVAQNPSSEQVLSPCKIKWWPNTYRSLTGGTWVWCSGWGQVSNKGMCIWHLNSEPRDMIMRPVRQTSSQVDVKPHRHNKFNHIKSHLQLGRG